MPPARWWRFVATFVEQLTEHFDVGNGGVLQRPAANYEEINNKIRNGEMEPGISGEPRREKRQKEK